jgi:hypothetical protein
LSLRRSIVLFSLLAALLFAWLLWRSSVSSQQPKITAAPTIIKQPPVIATRTFDPDNLPADMPPMIPGELAVTDSNFISDARVSANVLQLGATGAMVTVTQVTVTLQLTLTMWVPVGAAQHVIEHEEGHRQISEYFYRNADKLAARIASTYMGKQIRVTGTDTHAEISNLLQKLGAEITEEYGKELNPDPTQLRYDDITDHSRNEVDAKDAVAQALKEAFPASSPPATNPGN